MEETQLWQCLAFNGLLSSAEHSATGTHRPQTFLCAPKWFALCIKGIQLEKSYVYVVVELVTT